MNKRMLFIISEDYRVLESLRAVTSANDYEPKCFPSAEEFLAYLSPRQLGCVIVDLTDAAIHGGALVASMREQAEKLRSIVLTADGDQTDWRRLGAFAVLQKPCSTAALFEAIERALCDGD